MLTCIGAILVDEVVKLQSVLHPGASNPVRWSQALGGVATNVFLTARQQVSTQLIAAVGDDHNATLLRTAVNDPIDHLCVIPGYQSGRYCAVLDQQHELIVGLAETDVAEQLTGEHIAARLDCASAADVEPNTTAPIIVFDANLSVSCIHSICERKPKPTLVALTVSPVKAMRLLSHVAAIDLLLTNRREAAALSGLAVTENLTTLSDALVSLGFSKHVVTDGGAALIVVDGHQRNTIDVTHVEHPATVNGAGDALAGATVAHWSAGHSLTDSVAGPGLNAAQAVLTGRSTAPALVADTSNPGNADSCC